MKDLLEKDYEEMIVHILEDHGFWIKHMDSSVVGFPDLLVLKGNQSAFIEVKRGSRGNKVLDLVEPGQPVFASKLLQKGFSRALLAVCSCDKGHTRIDLYRMPSVEMLLNDPGMELEDIEGMMSGDLLCFASFMVGYFKRPPE